MKKVAIIGGGLTGLSMAYYLGKACEDWHITLYEESERFGGKISTKRVDGYVVETGPDSYLARKMEMTELIEELGLGETLVPNATGQAYIYDNQQMYPIPGGSIIGIPTEFMPFAKSTLISWPGKIRAGLDLIKAPYPSEEDVSIGDFFQYHLGKEMVDKLIEPLLAGIYGGDIYQLSLDATFPDFHSLERKHGNMVKGMMAMKAKQALAIKKGEQNKDGVTRNQPYQTSSTKGADGLFRQLTGGLEALVEALVSHMPKNVKLLHSCGIEEVRKEPTWTLVKGDGEEESFDKVIVTTPPKAYKKLFPKEDIFQKVANIELSSCAIAVMGFDKATFDKELKGTGFLITRANNTPLTACTYLSEKWPQTTPSDRVVLRVFMGKPGDTTVQDLSEEELKALAVKEIQRIMQFKDKPLWVELVSLPESMPQYKVKHRSLVAEVRRHIQEHYDGLFVIGIPFDGVGMPDGIKAAKQLVAELSGKE